MKREYIMLKAPAGTSASGQVISHASSTYLSRTALTHYLSLTAYEISKREEDQGIYKTLIRLRHHPQWKRELEKGAGVVVREEWWKVNDDSVS